MHDPANMPLEVMCHERDRKPDVVSVVRKILMFNSKRNISLVWLSKDRYTATWPVTNARCSEASTPCGSGYSP